MFLSPGFGPLGIYSPSAAITPVHRGIPDDSDSGLITGEFNLAVNDPALVGDINDPHNAFNEPDPSPLGGAGFSPLSGPTAPIPVPNPMVFQRPPTYWQDRQRWDRAGDIPTGAQEIPIVDPDGTLPSALTPIEWLFVEEHQPDVIFDWYLQRRANPDPVNVAELTTVDQVNRWFMWHRLTSVGKMLLMQLWPTPQAWILQDPNGDNKHPLEDSAVEFDRIMGGSLFGDDSGSRNWDDDPLEYGQ